MTLFSIAAHILILRIFILVVFFLSILNGTPSGIGSMCLCNLMPAILSYSSLPHLNQLANL